MFIFGNRRSAYLQTRMMSSLDKSFTNSWSQLIARAERIDQFCTAAATYTGRRCNAISYEGVEAGYEVCADRIDILCLSREDLLERDAGKKSRATRAFSNAASATARWSLSDPTV